MKTTGVIGLGDMGSGLAKNLIRNEFMCTGFDLSLRRLQEFEALGGHIARDVAGVAEASDAVFVMVMNGAQAHDVILGDHGLAQHMRPGSVIILSATIKPSEAVSIAEKLQGTGVRFIDSPVSGGFPGAQNGTLTLMAAAPEDLLQEFEEVLQAVSSNIHHVGNTPGEGQTVKACLQSIIGPLFSATFEAAVLAAKSGISGDVLYNVVSSSGAGCGVVNTSLENIIDRKFEGTGSHIGTMHKDLSIALSLAEEKGIPMHSASNAMQIFQAGRAKYPKGDNWVCTRVIEEIVGAELHRRAMS